ncbi:arabinan endo-1,5-alpha-L-arabinosidase [Dysgonomonas sp. 511]|uniref:arabinan endo-1,5-alpha-L-arabinosidase n=1 Tax=Dysgonomonas sp. 511 TaxID=2302930 RepID=UPI0013D31331|nr:arabinan endo-1,5-alpha-L-arabinosidase [Dysgonomonas sp. 511]NDV77562.1 arabinan endo-1,5-alpha-L-arabinosidase [Dysgonomonas sp. 511]
MIDWKNILLTGCAVFLLAACSDDDDNGSAEQPVNPPAETEYVAPSYADDYGAISGWDKRAEWNLANVHDPSVEKCGDYYYMYGTDASYGNVHAGHGHFPVRRSKDLVNWEFHGMAMQQDRPLWVRDTINSLRAKAGLEPLIDDPRLNGLNLGYWAPVVRKMGNKYRMYYSIVVDHYIKTGVSTAVEHSFDNSWTEHALIGMMECDNLANNIWLDKGMVIHSATDKGTDWYRASLNSWGDAYFKWNAIDPSVIVTPEGEHWMIYGSWHSGIVAVKLNPETGKPDKLETLADFGTRVARRVNNSAYRWQGQEAPEVIYNPETGYYYLFLAYDELSVAYNTRVCRSKSITGPYVGYDGKDISTGGDCWPILTHPYKFNNHPGWVGISHCCVFQNPDTKEWYYSSQGRLPANTNGNEFSNAIMMGHVRSIKWTEDGWPVVMPERYAAVPQDEITEADLVGSWENIFLNYQFQVQQASTILTLSADKKASGAITGNWNYNAETSTLTIGSYKLIVQRELDWEAEPRVPTIVYAGLTEKGISIWGKKEQ